jgi:adenine-specific DNA-methyltransferase
MNTQKINKIVKTDIKEGLKQIFPQIFEDNKINFNKLRVLLSGEIIEKEDDRFYFNWAGKSNLYKLIQAPAYGTLKPDKERSVDFDNTENIVIVGENLETLKLLLKPYFGKVKMIYIDPPYNTGKDFIYRDNFTQPLKDYLEKTGQIDSEGKKLTTNTEASGRYHSDWLNFMYPRLFLARSLLRDDGVIFVSIDDHEVHHLRMIMDEIFGEENFVANFIWEKTQHFGRQKINYYSNADYILCYAKNLKYNNQNLKEVLVENIQTEFEDAPLYNASNPEKQLVFKKGSVKFTGVPDGYYEKTTDEKYKLLNPVLVKNGINENDLYLIFRSRWSQKKINEEIEKGTKFWIKSSNFAIRAIYSEGKFFRNSPKQIIFTNTNNPLCARDKFGRKVGVNEEGSNELKELFDGKNVYDYPKPTSLIRYLISLLWDCEKENFSNDAIILDFFAGSGTTGHAVWDLNKEDGGNRKFILVQLDEEVQDEEIKKEFPTVADICIERLRRVSEKYKKEREEQLIKNEMDFGFKVFKLDKSNFNLKDEFEFDPSEDKEELKKKYLEWLGMFVDQPLVSGWKEIDVIYEVMLKEGLNLNSKIEKVKIKNDEFYYVKDEGQNLEFFISLKDKFSKDTIEEIRTSKYKERMFVFLDNALTDSDKINLSAFVRLKVI